MYHCIKQLEEKAIANEIDLLSWSGSMDLVAISNTKGEVYLHRLNWVKVWCLLPHKENIRVKAIAWKPDRKVIAIAYDTNQVLLVKVENKQVVNKIDIGYTVSCMIWAQENDTKKVKLTADDNDKKNYLKDLDNSAIYLPDPPTLSSLGTYSPSEYEGGTYSMAHKQTEFNLLVIGTKEGIILISIFGRSPFVTYNLNKKLGYKCSIVDILFSEDLNLMYVTILDKSSVIKVVIIETEIFRSHKKELYAICTKHDYLNLIANYLRCSILSIKETWENVLLEMDSKLSKYAARVPLGTLSTDFLDLLMIGTVSDNMYEFLLKDLTKKGLEKFGQTIEMSYSNIQKLLLRNVAKVGQNITYHLSELKGMARFKHRYECLGLQEEQITKAILTNGAFLVKCGEMQLIINSLIANYKAFFKWLFTAIVQLKDEIVPNDMSKMSEQDIAYIAEFVLNFDNIVPQGKHSRTRKGFVMERLGQYLSDTPLHIPSGIESNEWNNFLKQNECVKQLPNIINHSKNTSLVTQFELLEIAILDCFKDVKHSIEKQIKVTKTIEVTECKNPRQFKMTSKSNCNNNVSFAFLPSTSYTQGFYFLDLHLEEVVTGSAGQVFIPQYILQDPQQHGGGAAAGDNLEILDIQFYNSNYISLLLQENGYNRRTAICQISSVALREALQEVNLNVRICAQKLINVNATTFSNSITKIIDGMNASCFAVSGPRKVSIVLSENRRKVRIYEMEAEEDEEEDAEMTVSTVRESDVSMPDENSDGER